LADWTLGRFDSGGVEIAYLDQGEGPPTLLIHGFASSAGVNWVATSWVRDLQAARRRVVAFDNRGHGQSDKPHDPAAYHPDIMAEDARRLLDHLRIERADVIGYSMGARIAAHLALRHPGRVRRAVFSGLGDAMVRGIGPPHLLVAALRAKSLDEVTDPRGRAYRIFAEQMKSDREALAACVLGTRRPLFAGEVAQISVPVLVAVGTEDEIGGSAEALAALIPDGEAFNIPGRDHMKAVGDKRHKQAAIAFLDRSE
jgi:pimeloyl-ACP methyl ester carboxylesterase